MRDSCTASDPRPVHGWPAPDNCPGRYGIRGLHRAGPLQDVKRFFVIGMGVIRIGGFPGRDLVDGHGTLFRSSFGNHASFPLPEVLLKRSRQPTLLHKRPHGVHRTLERACASMSTLLNQNIIIHQFGNVRFILRKLFGEMAAFVKTVVGLRSKLFNHSGIRLFVRQLHPATRNLFHGLVDDEPLGA